jgi:hypothetical protein
MKKIKYYEQFLIESVYDPKHHKDQTVDIDGVKFYHGTVGYEIKSAKDLDPFFRDKSEFKKNQEDTETRSRSASARLDACGNSMVGIYFGGDPDKKAAEDAGQYYSDFTPAANKKTRGFMYEMTLKPDSKVISGPDYIKIGKEEYKKLRADGIDAVSNGPKELFGGRANPLFGSIVLLNPEAVQTWKELKRWEQPFDVVLSKYNPELAKAEATWKPGDILPEESIEVERKRFWDYDEMWAYINKFRPFEQSDAEWSNGRWTKDGKYCVTMRRPDTVYL